MGDDAVKDTTAKGGGSFVALRIRFHDVVDLVRCPCANPDQRPLYIQATLEPGNVAAATLMFTDPAQLPLEAALTIPSSLCFESASSSEIVVEMWGIQGEQQHELIGYGATTIEELALTTACPSRLALARRKGKASFASLTVSATVLPCPQLSPCASIRTDDSKGGGAASDTVHSALVLNLMVLAAVGLEKDMDPVLLASLQTSEKTLSCWSDVGVGDGEDATKFIWNHRWRFTVSQSSVRDSVLELSVFGQSGGGETMKSRVDVNSLAANDPPASESWIPLTRTKETGLLHGKDPRIRIAWHWELGESCEEGSSRVDGTSRQKQAVESCDLADSTQELRPPSISTLALPSLAATIFINIRSLCRLSRESIRWVETFIAACKRQPQELQIRVQLVSERESPVSECSVAGSSVRIVLDHCPRKVCAVFGDTHATAQLPMTPELAAALCADDQPSDHHVHQVLVKIRPKVSTLWSLSSSFAVCPVLREISPSRQHCDWSFALLNHEEVAAGEVSATVSWGTSGSQTSGDRSMPQWKHDSQPRRAVCQLQALNTSKRQGHHDAWVGNQSLQLRLWTNTTGRRSASVVRAISLAKADSAVAPVSVVLPVYDIDCEVFHVELYQALTDGTQRLLGAGTFTAVHPAEQTPATGRPEPSVIEKRVALFSTDDRKKAIQIAEAIIRVTLIADVGNAAATPESATMASSSSLRDVSYPVERCKGCSNLSFYLEQLQLFQRVNQHQVDAASIEFRLATHNRWASATQWSAVTTKASGQAVVVFDEHFVAPIHWSTKDRCLPCLHIRVKVKRRQPLEQPEITPPSRPAPRIPGNSHANAVQRARKRGKTGGTKAFIATPFKEFSLDLSAFFMQAGGPTRCFIPISETTSPVFSASASEEGQPAAALLLHVIVDQDQRSVRDGELALLPSQPQPAIGGDVCVCVQHASGSFLQIQDVEASSFSATVAWMRQSSTTSQVGRGGDGRLTWNEHLTLPVKCEAAPILQVGIFKRADNGLLSQEQLVASASFPLFPVLSARQHLMHFELPLSAPPTNDLPDTRVNDLPIQDQRKVGVLAMDVQFIEQSTTIATATKDEIELVVHELRGMLPRGPVAGASAFVRLEVYALRDPSADKPQRIWTTKPFAVLLSRSSATTAVNESVDLSSCDTPDDGATVIAVDVSDMSENGLGCVHIPLHKNWKHRLLAPTSRPNWYRMFSTSAGTSDASSDAALLVSFQRVQADMLTRSRSKEDKILYLGVVRAAVCLGFGDVGESIASLEISRDLVKRQTRRAAWSSAIRGWQWEDEWISLGQVGAVPGAQFHCELVIEGTKTTRRLGGEFRLPSKPQPEAALSLTEWIPLVNLDEDNASGTAEAFLLLHQHRLPLVTGVIELCICGFRPLRHGWSAHQVESSFLSCTFQSKTVTSSPLDSQHGRTEELDGGQVCDDRVTLRVPFSTEACATPRTPYLVIQWMGQSQIFGEMCLGSCSIELAACLQAQTKVDDDMSWAWYEFHERMDKAGVTAICQMKVAFEAAHQQEVQQTAGYSGGSSSPRVIAREHAATLAVWKKLFYLLDKDGNGVVDLGEFTDMFASHLEDMTATSDGKTLLTLLFASDDDKRSYTSSHIRAIFAEMDKDGDERIQWDEYLAFLRRRQLQGVALQLNNNSNVHGPALTLPDTVARKEQRRKNREDRRTSTSPASNAIAASITKPQAATMLFNERPAKPSSYQIVLPTLKKAEIELRAQVSSLAASLELEKQRYSKLHEDWQALQQSNQQRRLKQQREAIQELVRAKRMSETIERQEGLLREREAQRKQQHDASIILQSTLRSRLEQKRYHGVKMLRASAVTTLQCWYRQGRALKCLEQLKAEDEARRAQCRAATRLQRFVRYHLRRKERQLIAEARHMAARNLQKHVRGKLARVTWTTQRRASIVIQCWTRQTLARIVANHLREAEATVRRYVRWWICKRRYSVAKVSITRLQRWWKQAHAWRCEHLEQLEATICIQVAWRGKLARVRLKRRRAQHKIHTAQLTAVARIQATWRRAHQRVICLRSSAGTPPIRDATLLGQINLEAQEEGQPGVIDPASANALGRASPALDQTQPDAIDAVDNLENASTRSIDSDKIVFLSELQGDEALPEDESARLFFIETPALEYAVAPEGQPTEQVSPPGDMSIDKDANQFVAELIALAALDASHPADAATGGNQSFNRLLPGELLVDTTQPEEPTGLHESCASPSAVPKHVINARVERVYVQADDDDVGVRHDPDKMCSTMSAPTPIAGDCYDPEREGSKAHEDDVPNDLVDMQLPQLVVIDLVERVVEASSSWGSDGMRTAYGASDLTKTTRGPEADERAPHSQRNLTLADKGEIPEQRGTEEDLQVTQQLSVSSTALKGDAQSSASSSRVQLEGDELSQRQGDAGSIEGDASAASTTSDPVVIRSGDASKSDLMSHAATDRVDDRLSSHGSLAPSSSRDKELTDSGDLLTDSDDEREPRGESSIDSSDLVWDADAITAPQGTPSADSVAKSRELAPASRMDSERILLDLRRFESSA